MIISHILSYFYTYLILFTYIVSVIQNTKKNHTSQPPILLSPIKIIIANAPTFEAELHKQPSISMLPLNQGGSVLNSVSWPSSYFVGLCFFFCDQWHFIISLNFLDLSVYSFPHKNSIFFFPKAGESPSNSSNPHLTKQKILK